MKKRAFLNRYIVIGALFFVICCVYIVRLINMQIASRDYYVKRDTAAIRTLPIQALRGEILDRNGIPLVKNKISYDLFFEKGSMTGTNLDKNEAMIQVLHILEEHDAMEIPSAIVCPFGGEYPDMYYRKEVLAIEKEKAKFEKFLSDFKQPVDLSCKELVTFLLNRYGILNKDGTLNCAEKDIGQLLSLRYDMEQKKFDTDRPYLIAENIDITLITEVKELGLRGVEIFQSVEREYTQPGLASHVLGRVGKIYAENLQYYSDLGYKMDAIVGVDGVEKAFEKYLRGQDGELVIEEDAYGNCIKEYVKTEPIAGKNVWLTLDANLQKSAETALSEGILMVNERAIRSGKKLNGEDAKTGALSLMNPNNGEILALASYPSFDLTTYQKEYANLLADPLTPLVHRATMGIYPPGSTFKIATAAAALGNGIITPDTIIVDKGVYQYFAPSYKPRCWIYLMYPGMTHGAVNVTKAIQDSCNYYFFEVGRLLGIDKMNQYCKMLGLGESTGIEIPESKGILAGPEYRDSVGKEEWLPSLTIQAAIGQSDNAFTPLQMSTYISTIVNGGTRYQAHLLYKVTEFSGNVLYTQPLNIVSKAPLSKEHHEVLMNALKSVTENGSASSLFRGYKMEVGGKTGTAQGNPKKSDNAIFVAFAPFESPELVASCVIENGATGSNAGYPIRDVFSYYFFDVDNVAIAKEKAAERAMKAADEAANARKVGITQSDE